MGFLLLVGFATQTASLWLQVAGDMRKVHVIMNGIEGKLTAILPVKELRVRRQSGSKETGRGGCVT